MKRSAPLCIVMTILLLLAALSGCAATKLAGRIGDREIQVYQLENMFRQYESYASSYYGYDLTTEEGLNGFQDYLIDALLSSEAQVYMAEQAGVELTDEERATAKENAAAAFDEFYQEHLNAAKQSGAADVTAYANQLLTDTLEANKTTLSAYKKTLIEAEENAIRVDKHQDRLLAENAPTDEEIQASYDERAAEQKELFDATPSMYFTYLQYAQYGYMDAPVYVPEGMFYVRHILVADLATAVDLLARIESGEDFEALLAEYNIDPGMQSDAYAEGYIIGQGAETFYRAAFAEAALALQNEGDVSDIVETDDGFHIIKRLKDAAPGPAEITEDDRTAIRQSLENAYLNGLIEEAMQQVERFPENYRFIGRTGLVDATPEPAATSTPAN